MPSNPYTTEYCNWLSEKTYTILLWNKYFNVYYETVHAIHVIDKLIFRKFHHFIYFVQP